MLLGVLAALSGPVPGSVWTVLRHREAVDLPVSWLLLMPSGAGVTYSAGLAAVSRAWCISLGVDVAWPAVPAPRAPRAALRCSGRSWLGRCVGFTGKSCAEEKVRACWRQRREQLSGREAL